MAVRQFHQVQRRAEVGAVALKLSAWNLAAYRTWKSSTLGLEGLDVGVGMALEAHHMLVGLVGVDECSAHWIPVALRCYVADAGELPLSASCSHRSV